VGRRLRGRVEAREGGIRDLQQLSRYDCLSDSGVGAFGTGFDCADEMGEEHGHGKLVCCINVYRFWNFMCCIETRNGTMLLPVETPGHVVKRHDQCLAKSRDHSKQNHRSSGTE